MTHSLRLFSAAALTAAVCAVGIASASSAAAAAELKIGVVNMERILRESKTAIEASDRLNAEGQRRQEEIEGISRRFKSRLERFEKDAPTMDETTRLQERRALAEMERDVTRRSREAREEFNQRRNEEVLLLQTVPDAWCRISPNARSSILCFMNISMPVIGSTLQSA